MGWKREGEAGWTRVVSTEGDVADLASIGARLDVRELHEAAAEAADGSPPEVSSPAPMASTALCIRPISPADAPAVVRILREIVDDGTTYALPATATDAELRAYWFSPSTTGFVACDGAEVLGSYLLRPNQPGHGAHVANAAYAVAARAAGCGVGRAMGEHSLGEARARGYLAMQFNYVVSTNEAAVTLWTRLGFAVVGRSPRSFEHPRLGLVDTLIMHREL